MCPKVPPRAAGTMVPRCCDPSGIHGTNYFAYSPAPSLATSSCPSFRDAAGYARNAAITGISPCVQISGECFTLSPPQARSTSIWTTSFSFDFRRTRGYRTLRHRRQPLVCQKRLGREESSPHVPSSVSHHCPPFFREIKSPFLLSCESAK